MRTKRVENTKSKKGKQKGGRRRYFKEAGKDYVEIKYRHWVFRVEKKDEPQTPKELQNMLEEAQYALRRHNQEARSSYACGYSIDRSK